MEIVIKGIVALLMFVLAMPFAYSEECDISISIDSNKEIFDNGEKIEFHNKLSDESFDYIIEYWIEDINGSIVKRKMNTTNHLKKFFTPKNRGADIVIKARIAYVGCDETNSDNNFAEKKILFAGSAGNSTTKEAVVAFEIDKDIEKLKRFAGKPARTQYSSSKNSKILKAVPYFLVTLAVLISIVLIWRR